MGSQPKITKIIYTTQTDKIILEIKGNPSNLLSYTAGSLNNKKHIRNTISIKLIRFNHTSEKTD